VHASLCVGSLFRPPTLTRVDCLQALKAKSEARGTRLVGFAASNLEYVEHVFKQDTVGLQTKEQFAEKVRALHCRQYVDSSGGCTAGTHLTCTLSISSLSTGPQRANVEREVEEQRQRAAKQQEEEQLRALSKKRAAAKATASARLSFEVVEEEEQEDAAASGGAGGAEEPQQAPAEDGPASKRLRFGSVGKNPDVNTAFLPDRDRERQEREERERLKREWLAEQERLKAEPLEITFSYWDGSGHRRSITVNRGDTIATFLRGVRDALAPEFRELRSTSVDNMLYVKEDLIIPHVRGACLACAPP
jgi:protein FAM50